VSEKQCIAHRVLDILKRKEVKLVKYFFKVKHVLPNDTKTIFWSISDDK